MRSPGGGFTHLSAMLIIPAIDIKDGKVVRLRAGDFGKETVYGDDPVAAAQRWESDGAKFLHIVDLDGAREGKCVNFDQITSVIRHTSIPVEVGGGIRDKETIRRFLKLGVKLVILGTRACTELGTGNSPEFLREVCAEFGESIAVSVDSTGTKVAIEGWTKVTSKDAVELIREAGESGIRSIIFTDIKRDGVLSGFDIKHIRKVLEVSSVPVTIAGGISSIEDIQELEGLKSSRIRGVIIGRALYTGAIQLKEALRITN